MHDLSESWADLRRRAILRLLRMHYESGVGHLGGNLSCLDVMLVLHHDILRPSDQFVLSKGHSAGAYYIALWSLGRLEEDDLQQFHKDGTRLSGHPPTSGIDEILFATGSLGHGLSLAAGLALAKQLKGEAGRVYLPDVRWRVERGLVLGGARSSPSIVASATSRSRWTSTGSRASARPARSRTSTRWPTSSGPSARPTNEIDGHDPDAIRRAMAPERAGPPGGRGPHPQGVRHLVPPGPDGLALPAVDRTPVPPGGPRGSRQP